MECFYVCCTGAAQSWGDAAGSNSKTGTPAAADTGLQRNTPVTMHETIMLAFYFGHTSAGAAASNHAQRASTAQQEQQRQQQQLKAQMSSDCSNCGRCTSECRVDCCARFASQSEVIAEVTSVAGLNPCTWECARACGLLPSLAVVPADPLPSTALIMPFAAATSAPDAIKQQYQRLKSSTVLSSPGFESPDKVRRPGVGRIAGQFHSVGHCCYSHIICSQ